MEILKYKYLNTFTEAQYLSKCQQLHFTTGGFCDDWDQSIACLSDSVSFSQDGGTGEGNYSPVPLWTYNTTSWLSSSASQRSCVKIMGKSRFFLGKTVFICEGAKRLTKYTFQMSIILCSSAFSSGKISGSGDFKEKELTESSSSFFKRMNRLISVGSI